jgi:Flp pilus assembly protein TadG
MNKQRWQEMTVRDVVVQNHGVIATMVAVLLISLLGFVALVMDFGFALVTRNQLQNIADGAALAGSRQLGRIYEALTPAAQQGYVLTGGNKSAILTEVREIGESNVAGGKVISINTDDIVIGRWNNTTRQLTPTDVHPDAVSVVVRRDSQANSPLSTFFAGLVGTPNLHVSARATAALMGLKEVPAGELNAPFAISHAWFDNHADFCDRPIQFSPTNSSEGCAGWHTFFQAPTSQNLRRILNGLRDDTFTSPGAIADETQFNFINFSGNTAGVGFRRFRALYNDKAICSTTGTLCSAGPCGGTCEFSAFVGVYNASDCANPSTPRTIVGFATATIDEVENPGRIIRGRVQCDIVRPNMRRGGPHFGTKGSIPGLVQ